MSANSHYTLSSTYGVWTRKVKVFSEKKSNSSQWAGLANSGLEKYQLLREIVHIMMSSFLPFSSLGLHDLPVSLKQGLAYISCSGKIC